jgi:hypothetical protein|tara:strand:+ start:1502 stop:1714 length:213 start_codon:yes stop_codon:yes gene_type:complete
MPVKFKDDYKKFDRATKKTTVEKYYIKNTPKQELIDYINSSYAKPKIVQKCKNELTRRGIKLVWKTKESV